MKRRFEIRRRVDAQSVLGDHDGIDPSASLTRYCAKVSAAIEAAYPTALVVVDWHWGPEERTTADIPEGLDYYEVWDEVGQIQNRVWEQHDWWVEETD